MFINHWFLFKGIGHNLSSEFHIITGMQIIAQYIIHNVFIKRSIKMDVTVNNLQIKGYV